MSLERMVRLVNEGNKITLKWDSKVYEIGKGKHVEVKAGVAQHWIEQNPKASLKIEEIIPEKPEKREPVDPLKENNRGEAFSELSEQNG